jgi:hypothetical protein
MYSSHSFSELVGNCAFVVLLLRLFNQGFSNLVLLWSLAWSDLPPLTQQKMERARKLEATQSDVYR